MCRRGFVVAKVAGAASCVCLLLYFGRRPLPLARMVDRDRSFLSMSGYDLSPLTDEEIEIRVNKLTELEKRVLIQGDTEPRFQGETVNGYPQNTKAEGTWVNAVSGVPLFSSEAKYDSGTGWPSFYEPIDPEHVVERLDPKDAKTIPKLFRRTEVLDRKSGTHVGHVFNDGPRPTGNRYCVNAAAMLFVPKGEPLPVMPKLEL